MDDKYISDARIEPKVAVLEDDRYAKEGIIAELQSAGAQVVGAVGDINALMNIVQQHELDVIIIDLKLGRDDMEFKGLDVIGQIKTLSPNIKCIVVTAFPSIPNFKASIRAGAEGFIAKESSIESSLSMGEVVLRVLKGEKVYDGDLVKELVLSGKDYSVHEQLEGRLTDREIEVLGLVATGDTNKQIGEKLKITEDTVKSHLRSVFEKLSSEVGRDIDNRRDAADIGRARGYI